MNTYPFEFAGARLVALESGGLWWPDKGLYCVSDLHFGKSERMARNGGPLLPPYETLDTLTRLETDLDRYGPDIVISLGDSFDDVTAADGLSSEVVDRLTGLQAGRRWIWIAGNHDPAPIDLGGEHHNAFGLAPLVFRHEAEETGAAEVSGHYHPKARLSLRGRGLTRRCFLLDGRRLILPAFGTFTGGLRSDDRALSTLMDDPAEAILTGTPMARIPMPRGNMRV